MIADAVLVVTTGSELLRLRALREDAQLEGYYEKIGFTSRPQAFEDAGLMESYEAGDMLLPERGAPVR